MTISAAIAACDRMRPNTFAYGEKEAWLRELEARIREEKLTVSFSGLSEDELIDRLEAIGLMID